MEPVMSSLVRLPVHASDGKRTGYYGYGFAFGYFTAG